MEANENCAKFAPERKCPHCDSCDTVEREDVGPSIYAGNDYRHCNACGEDYVYSMGDDEWESAQGHYDDE